MTLTVLNDLHLGVQRSAGTTPATSLALRDWVMESFIDFLGSLPKDETLLINGDVFDGYNVPLAVVGCFVEVTSNWLKLGPRRRLVLSRGNHDISRDSTNLSSFDFAASFLEIFHQAQVQVVVVVAPAFVDGVGYVIPHAANQDIFDTWLEGTPEGCTVFLHANFDNNFAVCADHSLNVSYVQAEKLIEEKSCTLIFAHEHQARVAFQGRLQILGNQWPSSIADCLGNAGNRKYALQDGAKVQTWDGNADFIDTDWRSLSTLDTSARFIRVSGKATAAEATDAINAVARLRRDNDTAFVISNAIAIEGKALQDGVQATVESIKAFNPLDLVFELLEPRQVATLKTLLQEAN